MALNISISAEPIAHLFGLTISNSLFTSWIITIVLTVSVIMFSRSIVSKGAISRFQSFIEMIIEGLFGVVESIAGNAKARVFFPMVATLFFFIIVSNWSGLLPGLAHIGFQGIHNGHAAFIPYWRAPTSDINTTLALGFITMVMVQAYGVKYLGLKYFKKFFDFSNPINFFVGILELISDISKIISFTFRLFGNIIAGEILLLVMSMLVPLLGPTPFIALEIFVGFIQALVFMMLASVFINMATLGHGDEHNA